MAPTDEAIAASPLATRFIDDVPSIVRDDPDVRAVLYARARLIEELDAAVDRLYANLLPHTADSDGLALWEMVLGLTIRPPTLTVEERRSVVLIFYRASNDGSGLGWERVVGSVVGPGSFSYEEHLPGRTTPGGVPAYTVVVRPSFPPTSDVYDRLRRVLGIITPANTDLNVDAFEGFYLDVSRLDDEGLG